MDETLFSLLLVPALIFCAKICDVSLGTMRIIYLAKGEKLLVPILGFFEILIWITAISQVMQHLTNFWYYMAYAGGFAAGNYVGLLIEEKMAIGTLIVRVFTPMEDAGFSAALLDRGIRHTCLTGQGNRGPVKIVFTIIKRKEKHKLLQLLNDKLPDAFYTVEEVRASRDQKSSDPLSGKTDRYLRWLFLRRRKER